MDACKNDYCHKKVVGSKPYLFSGKIKKAPNGAFFMIQIFLQIQLVTVHIRLERTIFADTQVSSLLVC